MYLVKSEFRLKASSVSKKDFLTIEHMLRQGQKQNKLLRIPETNSFGFIGK